jgi:hypothetical protein
MKTTSLVFYNRGVCRNIPPYSSIGIHVFIYLYRYAMCNGMQCASIDINTHNKKCFKKVLLSSKVDEILKILFISTLWNPINLKSKKSSSLSFLVVRRLCEKWLAKNVEKLYQFYS